MKYKFIIIATTRMFDRLNGYPWIELLRPSALILIVGSVAVTELLYP
jgi:hypothetical protein